MRIKPTEYPLLFLVLALILALPAFLTNLGEQTFIDDEATRALVAFEMIKSGDFVTPTEGGEIYLRKPPLFNWLVALSFKLFGEYSEFAARMPMVVSLFLLTLAIFGLYRRELGEELAVVSALMFLTCGRIIIYESLVGLIDLTFSFLTFSLFILIYKAFNHGNLMKLFAGAYILTAFSFLLKGLPSVVFLGITLLVLFISHKKFRLLFDWRHYLGIFLFVLIVGSYYVLYFWRNQVEPGEMLSVMFGETTRRTALRFGILNTILHMITFPFEMIYHFLPWSILILFLFKKGVIKRIRKNHFLWYISLVFVFNIIVYWTSPEVYPRYILMLMPLFFAVVGFFYLEAKKSNTSLAGLTEIVFGTALTLAALASLSPIFLDLPAISNTLMISVSLCIALGLVSWFYWRQKTLRIYWFVIGILVFRIGFDLIVLPVRAHESKGGESKDLAFSIAGQTSGEELFYWWDPDKEATGYYGRRLTSYRFSYYLSIARDEIIKTTTEKKENAWYITPEWNIDREKIDIAREFLPIGSESPVLLFKFRNHVFYH
jgi:4-amino-4-deoxy-L-arabinose transferase-like glycosyltransferase